jgi:hypothetical protein
MQFVSKWSESSHMLRCNMTEPLSLQLGLDDLLADLQHARRCDELGRLALLTYCDVRCWARQAGELGVAEHSMAIFTEHPHASKEDFLERVDNLISELQRVRPRLLESRAVH